MKVKITYFFDAVQAAFKYAPASLGWTETFYATKDANDDLDKWLDDLDVNSYLTARRLSLPALYRIAWLRIADEDNPRSFKVKALDNQFGLVPIGEAGSRPAQVTCALLVDLVKMPAGGGDHTHHRKFLVRGLPGDMIEGNVVDTNTIGFQAVKRFLNWLANHEVGDAVNAPIPPFLQRNASLGIRYQDPAHLAFTPSPAVVVAPGDSHSISLATALPGGVGLAHYLLRGFPDEARAFNRTWMLRFSAAGPPAVSVLGRARRVLEGEPSYTPPGAGEYRLVAPLYGIFNQYTIIGLRMKKTGRLFRQLRGRSSNR